MKKTYWGILALVIITALAGYIYNEYNRKMIDVAELPADFKVAAPNLLKEFAADETTATARYINKVIRVQGTVRLVDTDASGFNTVVLGEPESMSAVRCSLDSIYNNQVASIAIGKTIVVQGICAGYTADELGIGSDLLLDRCTIIK